MVSRREIGSPTQKCLKCESASRHFQPGEGPSRGLLRDCTTSLINRFAALSLIRCLVCASARATSPLDSSSTTAVPEGRPPGVWTMSTLLMLQSPRNILMSSSVALQTIPYRGGPHTHQTLAISKIYRPPQSCFAVCR